MNLDPSETNELVRLFGALSEGTITAEDHARLQDSLSANAEARSLWFVFNDVEAGLRALALAEISQTGQQMVPVQKRKWLLPMAAMTAALALFAGSWLLWKQVPASEPFVRLVATTNARWADPNVELALSSGEQVTSPLRLESGHAEFQMLDGATVVLDGPASVRFTERKIVQVEEGRVFCKCPTPESRIVVITPQTKIVDLGTEFTVDARADESTRVAVLSGKVQVLSLNAGVLTAGEVVDVRRDQVVRLKPLGTDEIAALTRQVVSSRTSDDVAAQDHLLDPGFEKALPSVLWRGTDDCLGRDLLPGRSGAAVRIRAMGKHFPLVKQRVETGDISHRVVLASVWAKSPADDPISPRQFAVLKLAFLNAEGREFACSTRHFLHKGQPANAYVPAQLAAQAPPGTRFVEVQLMLAAGSQKTGSVCFDDASLVIDADAEK